MPALIVVLGADPAHPEDERVERFTDSLARIGFAVLLTQSEELDSALVLPVEVDRLVGAFEALEAHPRVRADAIGYVGLSAGGSLAIVAASQDAIAGRVAFTLAIGPYNDAATLVANVAAREFRTDDGVSSWEPAEISRRAIRTTLLHALPPGDRDAIADRDPGTEPTSPEAQSVASLLDSPTLIEAEALVEQLGDEQTEALRAVSPRYAIAGHAAPLYLLHDGDDEFVPWTESEAMAAAQQPEVYHRLDLFEHVDPDAGNVRYVVRDGWRLLRLFVRIIDDLG